MEILQELFKSSGFHGEASLVWQNLVMFVIGGVLITLAVKKNFEPLLLIPIGFGAILANLPGAEMSAYSEATAAASGRCSGSFIRLRLRTPNCFRRLFSWVLEP